MHNTTNPDTVRPVIESHISHILLSQKAKLSAKDVDREYFTPDSTALVKLLGIENDEQAVDLLYSLANKYGKKKIRKAAGKFIESFTQNSQSC